MYMAKGSIQLIAISGHTDVGIDKYNIGLQMCYKDEA